MNYRTREEMEEWKQRDPIDLWAGRLLAAGVTDTAALHAINREVETTMDDAVRFAAASPPPALETVAAGVYGDTHEGRMFR